MSIHHIRNAIAVLLILTLCNIVASFATLYAIHIIRDVDRTAAIVQAPL